MERTNVLLAEDDHDFGSILQQYLMLHDFDVIWAKDGAEAYEVFTSGVQTFDICVFDVMMPKLDGFSLAEKVIQHDPEVSFVFLTAKKMKEDKIRGLQLGADDYIVKPFEADILILRLQNILKRTQQKNNSSKNEQTITIGTYVFDKQNYQLQRNGETQRITEKEAQLIQYFYDRQNQMVKREDVLENVWGSDDFFSGRSMDVFISRLRKYFKKDPAIAIESTRGVGLTFRINN